MKKYEDSTYKVERNFLNSDNISLNLQCCICDDIFNNPVRLDCGHTFCYECISSWMKKKKECPNCKMEIVESLISRDLLAFNMTEELEVSCNNENLGCPWKGQLCNLLTHLKNCNDNISYLQERKTSLITPIKQNWKKNNKSSLSEKKELSGNILSILLKTNKNISLAPGELTEETIQLIKSHTERKITPKKQEEIEI